ncbi:hypothetical protein [Parendozoicomonas sp. Alg238-R29]|uniref:hypothetical protein n=1 Tax=Parendozoicomonas sp. Alg238-R29 TaxID=2993446 RepID=UPI00248E2CD1|nr:hypothetical protein [Parendozoicomonas sp. Alg238-R29]
MSTTTYTTSQHLNQRQLQAVCRIGDIMVPSDNDFPSFSESGCLYNIDTMLEPTPESDLKSLKLVLTLLSFLPLSALRWLLESLQKADNMPKWSDALASQLRLLLFGLRGIVFTLYYAGQGNPYRPNRVHHVMDYHVSCKPDIPNAKNKTQEERPL